MDFDTYRKVDAVNWSTLKHILRSPLHYQHALAHPVAETPAMRVGSAVHCAVLEPDTFPTRYVVIGAGELADIAPPRNTRDGKEAWAEYLAEHPEQPATVSSDEYQRLMLAHRMPGRSFLDADTYARCLAMRDAVQGHAVARQYVTGRGLNEHTVEWQDAAIGRCKGRLDRVSFEPGAIVDLKTAREIDSSVFGRAAARLLYHAQVAWYQQGYEARTQERLPCVIIAVESEAPHDVAVIDVDEDSLEAGRDDVKRAVALLAECRASGQWPGRYPSRVALQLPSWVFPDEGADDIGLDFGSAPNLMEV